MKYIKKLSLLFLMIACSHFFGQSKSSTTHQKKLYQYSFEGELNASTLSGLEARLTQLQYVTQTKVKYKADSKKGEVFLYTNEKVVSSESDKGFDIVELKKLLSSTNLTPLELKTTPIE